MIIKHRRHSLINSRRAQRSMGFFLDCTFWVLIGRAGMLQSHGKKTYCLVPSNQIIGNARINKEKCTGLATPKTLDRVRYNGCQSLKELVLIQPLNSPNLPLTKCMNSVGRIGMVVRQTLITTINHLPNSPYCTKHRWL